MLDVGTRGPPPGGVLAPPPHICDDPPTLDPKNANHESAPAPVSGPPPPAAGPPVAPLAVPGTGLTYESYLKIDALLGLQQPRSQPAEHDEMLFIVVHQVYELWFKQVLHELGRIEASFDRVDAPAALGTFKRILTILKTLVAQVDVLESMTPIEFSSFRARLESASGFQSLQFRLIEMKLGKRDPRVIAHFGKNPAVETRLQAALAEPPLFDRFLRFIAASGVPVTGDTAAALISIYRNQPNSNLAAVCERMVDLDEGLQEWRYRHVKMVERTIGFKPGTGGSAGAAYLRTTLSSPLFPELWAIRSQL
jgi:tryptophan 2,3-dioxygenase